MTLKQLAGRLARTGGPITGRASLDGTGAVGVTFATMCVDVEVDPDTGKVQVLRCTIAQDAGRHFIRVTSRGSCKAEWRRASAGRLMRSTSTTKGLLRNSALLDYRMPTCLDLPDRDDRG